MLARSQAAIRNLPRPNDTSEGADADPSRTHPCPGADRLARSPGVIRGLRRSMERAKELTPTPHWRHIPPGSLVRVGSPIFIRVTGSRSAGSRRVTCRGLNASRQWGRSSCRHHLDRVHLYMITAPLIRSSTGFARRGNPSGWGCDSTGGCASPILHLVATEDGVKCSRPAPGFTDGALLVC